MPRKRTAIEAERLNAFGAKLRKLRALKNMSAAELARRANAFLPEGQKLERDRITAYSHGRNEPSEVNLKAIAKVLGVKPQELLSPAPSDDESPQFARVTSTLDGKTRLLVDAEVDPEVAIKVLTMVRQALPKKDAS